MKTDLSQSRAKRDNLNKIIQVLCFVVVALAYILVRAVKLDQFVVQDENQWLTRSANFYTAIFAGDFASTYQKEHPGVTIMWAGAAAFLREYPGYRLSDLGQVDSAQLSQYFAKFDKSAPLKILQTGRFFVLLGSTFAFLLAYLYAQRLFGLLPAIIAFFLIAFDPFYVALTRILHLDGLMSTLFFLSLLAYFSFLKDRKILDLAVSGVAAGLCWLTKSPGFFLGVLIVLFALVSLWQNRNAVQNWLSARNAWRYIYPILIWGAIAGMVFVVLWPAMWVAPVDTLKNVILHAQEYAEAGHDSAVFFNGNLIEDGNLGWNYFYFYPYTFLWRSTPVALAGLLIFVWGYVKRKKPLDDGQRRWIAVGLALSAGLFMFFMTFGLKKFDRYVLPAYLPLDLLAGLGWTALVYWLLEQTSNRVLRVVVYLGLAAVLAFQAFLTIKVYPYYIDYYNPLLGGPRQALKTMQVGWGEGLDQAAAYLNDKPGAAKMNVYSWYSRGSFSYFFDGTARELGSDIVEGDDSWNRLINSDYAVIYVSQWQRNVPVDVLNYLKNFTPEHTISLNGIDYARIYKLK